MHRADQGSVKSTLWSRERGKISYKIQEHLLVFEKKVIDIFVELMS